MKKLLSGLLSLTMVFSLTPSTIVLADGEDNSDLVTQSEEGTGQETNDSSEKIGGAETTSKSEENSGSVDLNTMSSDELYEYLLNVDDMDALYEEYPNLNDLISKLSEDQQNQLAKKFGNSEEDVNLVDNNTDNEAQPAPNTEGSNTVVSSGKCGNNLNWTLDSNGKLTISGTGDMSKYLTDSWDCSSVKTVVIEEGVTSISDNAFYNCTNLAEVTISNSVTAIGFGAFFCCEKLTSVVIPNGVTTIEPDTFQGCNSLESITIPKSVTSIGEYAFDACGSLTSIKIPGALTKISPFTFRDCHKLTNINIPNSVTSIGTYAFLECDSLTDITIPNSVTSIENYAFQDCNNLKSITISNTLASIGTRIFCYCPQLTDIYFYGTQEQWDSISSTVLEGNDPTSVTVQMMTTSNKCGDNLTWTLDSDGKLTIRGTGEMTSHPWTSADVKTIEIKDGVTSICDNAFYRCTNLENIDIPSSVTSIGSSAFLGCEKLTNIVIPDGVTKIESSTFLGCYKLESITIPDSVTSIGGHAFGDCESLKSIDIPSKVTSIGDYAFAYCTSLAAITIPSSLTSIGDTAFQCCSRVTGINFNGTQEEWDKISSNIIDSLGTTPYVYIMVQTVDSGTCGENVNWTLYSNGKLIIKGEGAITSHPWDYNMVKTVVIESGVTSIGNYAFSGCYLLTSIEIPDSVETIGEYAFFACESLTSITIPNGVTSIGNSAFDLCYGLTSITIPKSVITIGDSVFSCCRLTDIYFYGTQEKWDNIKTNVLSGVYPEPTVHILFVDSGDCGDNLTWTLDSNGKLTISGTGTMYNYEYASYRGEYHPWDNSDVKTVVIEDGVTSIGNDAFINCSNLTDVKIPNSVTSIGSESFLFCDSLTSITIPESVITIGDSAFSCCRLTDIYFYGTQEKWDNMKTNVLKDVYSEPTVHIIVNSGKCGNNLTWTLDSEGKLTVSGKGKMYDYLYYNIYDRHHPWDDSAVKTVVIEDNVSSIGNFAFFNCSNLTDVKIPNSVTSIGSEAFEKCTKLKSIEIPDGVTEIGDFVFSRCTNLENISISCRLDNSKDILWGLDSNVSEITVRHDLNEVDKMDATCTTDGHEAYWKCETCKKMFSDKNGTIEITEPEVISASHKYGKVTYAWSSDYKKCTATRECETCHHVDTETKDSTSEVTRNKSCTESELTKYSVTFDNEAFESQTKDVETATAKGHSLTKIAEVKATCEKDGSEVYWECSDCHKMFSDSEGKKKLDAIVTIPATGHKLTKVDEIKAICTTAGQAAYWECKDCHKKFSDENGTNVIEKPSTIDALGHKLTEVEKVDATCTTDGHEAYWECSTCKSMFSDAEGKKKLDAVVTIPATGHKYGKATYTWSDDHKQCTAIRECATCHDKDTETKDSTSRVIRNQSCTESELTEYSVTFKNSAFEAQSIEIVTAEATGHKVTEVKVPTTPKTFSNFYTQNSILNDNSELVDAVDAVVDGEKTTLPITWSIDKYDSTDGATNTFKWKLNINNDEYDISESCNTSGTVTINNKQLIPVTIKGMDSTVTYNGSTIDVSKYFVIGETSSKPIYTLVSGKGILDGTTLTVEETGTFKIRVSTSRNDTYESASEDVTLTVNKGDITYSANGYDGTYDGSAHSINVTTNANVTYSTDGVHYSETNPNFVNAGEYTVYYKIENGSNYNVVSDSKKVKISPKTVAVTATSASKVYGDKDPDLTYTISGVDTLSGIKVNRKSGEDVGTYDIKVSVDKDANPNYSVTCKGGTLTIKPKDISEATVTLGSALIYTGSEQTQEIKSVKLDGKDVTYKVSGNVVTDAGKHTLTVTGTGNFTGTISVDYVVASNNMKETTDGKVSVGEGKTTVDVNGEVKLETTKAELLEMLIQNGSISAEQLKLVYSGSDLNVSLNVNEYVGLDEGTKSKMIDGARSSGLTISKQFLNITLLVNDHEIHSTGMVKASVVVPDNLINTDSNLERTYYMVRYHEGDVSCLEGKFNEKTHSFTFETDKFSAYAIAYKDVVKKTSDQKETKKDYGNGTIVLDSNESNSDLIDSLIASGDITEEELKNVSSGSTLNISLKVTDVSSSVSSDEKTSIKKKVESLGYTIGNQYVNVGLYKNAKALSSTTSKVSASVSAPNDMINTDSNIKRTYYVVGNGNSVECSFDEKTNSITFETNTFGSYALAYKDVVKKTSGKKETTVNYGDGKIVSTNSEIVDSLIASGDITSEELEKVKSGSTLNISLKVTDVSDTVSSEVKSTIQQKAKELGYTVGDQYVDINLYKDAKIIKTTSGKVKASVSVPDTMVNTNGNVKRTYYVIGYCEGKVVTIEGMFDEDTQSFTFETNQFSTYVLAYKDTTIKQSETKTDTTNKLDSKQSTKKSANTGVQSNMGLYIALVIVSMIGLVVLVRKKKVK